MSDKKEDNVIQFPTTANTSQEKDMVDVPANQEEKAALILKKLATNRRKGLEGLQHKVDLMDQPHEALTNLALEDRLRDIENSVRFILLNLESLNTFTDICANDLVQLGGQFEQMSFETFQGLGHLQIVLDTLKGKGVVSEEELKKSWEKMVQAAKDRK